MGDREVIDRNPASRIKAPRRKRKPIDWLRKDEDDAFMKTAVTPQERIVCHLLRNAGLRVGEACTLGVGDIDLEREELRVR